MTIKIGNDIVCIKRFEQILQKRSATFLSRFLNPSEILLIVRSKIQFITEDITNDLLYKQALSHLQLSNLKIESIAGLWSAKEALSKALGYGIGSKIGFRDMEIFKDNLSAPHMRLLNNKDVLFKISDISISISHDRDFAIASAIIVRK